MKLNSLNLQNLRTIARFLYRELLIIFEKKFGKNRVLHQKMFYFRSRKSFSYPINSTMIYNGIALNINGSLYFMSDNENVIYWTEFTNQEIKSNKPFSKSVRKGKCSVLYTNIFRSNLLQCVYGLQFPTLVDRLGDRFHFQTDFIDYIVVASGTETEMIQSDYPTM